MKRKKTLEREERIPSQQDEVVALILFNYLIQMCPFSVPSERKKLNSNLHNKKTSPSIVKFEEVFYWLYIICLILNLQ